MPNLLLDAVARKADGGAAYGVTVLIWLTQVLFGTEPSGAIVAWVPIAVFVFLFGLSMDYELFILARMREEYDQHGYKQRTGPEPVSTTHR